MVLNTSGLFLFLKKNNLLSSDICKGKLSIVSVLYIFFFFLFTISLQENFFF